ncbi:MAG TPA: hypothetical protein VNE42_02570 [Acidimicrobiales bacterium]|nr:hypothetical protein [Acidimicrobiales bacterium]
MALSIEERYLRLGLQIGRHVERVVDAYFGPPELAAEVAGAPPPDPKTLVVASDGLLDELSDGWLRDQVVGLRTYAGVLAGESMSYADEATGCYGVCPKYTDETVFVAAHERLEELLSGPGSLAERYRGWEEAMVVPSAKLEETIVDTIETARRLTRDIIVLPEGERTTVDTARDVTWMAYCKYLGNMRSRISVNVDRPLSAFEVLTVATHEAYPGHHTERSCKEQFLVRDRQLLEETIVLIPTPQSLIAEGIGRMAPNLLLEGAGGTALTTVLHDAGVEFDLPHALAVRRAHEICGWAVVNVALLLDEHKFSHAEASEYLERWGLVTSVIATHLVRYLFDPTTRTYVITYLAGQALCESYVADNQTRFSRLLKEQLRVRDLLDSGPTP